MNDTAEGTESDGGSARARSAARPGRRFGDVEIGALLFVLAFGYFGLTLGRTFDLRDEGYIYYGVKKVAEGAIPHRDFVCLYGPGVYALSAVAYRLFGDEIMGVRLLISAIRAGAVVLAFALACRIAPRRFALIAAGLAAAYWGKVIWNLNTPYAALYTIPLGMAALLILLRAMSRDSLRWFAAAGTAAGLGILFKQSLGLVIGYGLLLSIGASGMLQSTAGRDDPRVQASISSRDSVRTTLLLVWLLGGVAIAAPFATQMSAFDYALHFLPLHTLMVLLGVHFARFGNGRAALALALPRLLAYGAGLATPPAIVACLYAYWGALGKLGYEMFVFPGQLKNYYLAVAHPPPVAWGVLLSSVALPCVALLLLSGRWVAAAAVGVPAVALAVALYHSIGDWVEVGVHIALTTPVLPTCVAFGALAVLAPRLRAISTGSARQWLETAIAILFFQLMMSFQIFPRATYNVTLMLGTLTPIAALLLHRLTTLARTGPSAARGWVATAIVAFVPLALSIHIVMDNLDKRNVDEAAHTGITRAGATGIRVAEGFYIPDEIAAFEWALDYIDRTSPPGAPIGMLTNDFMVHVLSGRPDLFPEFTYYLFLFGWDFLPDEYENRMPEDVLIARLANTPDPVLLDKDGFASANLHRHYPELFRYIAEHFQVEYRVGSYRVLRKNPT